MIVGRNDQPLVISAHDHELPLPHAGQNGAKRTGAGCPHGKGLPTPGRVPARGRGAPYRDGVPAPGRGARAGRGRRWGGATLGWAVWGVSR